jgi:hypothetical protein
MAKKPKSLPSDDVADVTGEPQTKEVTTKGRPSIYSDELINTICLRIAEGESLNKICKDEKMPDKATVFRWLVSDQAFCDKYARARELQAETQFDELIDIVDQPPELSYVTGKDGEVIEVKFDSSYVAWMKLRVDTRKWTAARMAPKKYGEYKPPEEKVDSMIVDGEIKNVMDVAIKRLELIRIAE